MGGRGSSSGGRGGGGGGASAPAGGASAPIAGQKTLQDLLNEYNAQDMTQVGRGTINTGYGYVSKLNLGRAQVRNDYDDNGNPALQKWQNQTPDKSAKFLAKVDQQTDLNKIQQQTGDKWSFYDNPQQKLVAQLDLNKPTTELSDQEFKSYVKKTGSTVLYRGWQKQDSVDRFNQSPNSHIGTGINGDGYYYAPDLSTARGYARNSPTGVVTKACLSPSARVVGLGEVEREYNKTSGKFRSSLDKAGSYGSRSYGSNDGKAQLALKMGYNVIDAGWAVIPLTRDAVIVSNKNV